MFLFSSEVFETYGSAFIAKLKSNRVGFDRGLFFLVAIRDERGITIYGSDLLILLAYAPSMPPLLSLSLSMACDDSDGCVTMMDRLKGPVTQANRFEIEPNLARLHRTFQPWRLEVSFKKPSLGYKARSDVKGIDKIMVISIVDWLVITGKCICILAMYNMSLGYKATEKGEIIHSLAWQRIVFAAMVGQVTTLAAMANLMLLVYKLLLLVLEVNAASTKVTTAKRLRLLKEFLLSRDE
ncbi:hypothetical protein Tco_0129071 [Tanacetum coccineum]